MNGLLHFSHFDVKLILLLLDQLVKSVATLSESDLEIDLCQLQLVFIVIHSGREVFVKTDHVVANFSHLVD